MENELKTINEEELVKKLMEVIGKSVDEDEKDEIHIFNKKEVEILRKVIRLGHFLESLGIFGNIILKILLWGTGMITALAVYKGWIING